MGDFRDRSVATVAATTTAVAAAAIATTATATAITTETARAATATTTAAEAAAFAVTAAKSATAWRTFLARTRDVHRERAAFHLEAVEFFDGLLRLVAGGHGDEGESAGAAGKFVEDDLDDADGPDLTEQSLEVLRGASEGKVPHVELTIVHVMIRS